MHQSAPGSAPRVQGTLPPGQRVKIGQWTVSIDRFLVSGGYAHVYVVSSTEPILGATQHILKHVTVPSKQQLTLVRTEVDVMKKLKSHPYIVNFYEACASPLSNSPGAYEVFILMEYCQGGGLLDLLNARRNNRLSELEVLLIFDNVCRSVAQMHSQKPPLIHRDLKIENVLLSWDKSDLTHSNTIYKLCDFGSTAPPSPPPQSVADIRHLEEEINRTTTPWYRAPEMCDISFHNPIGAPSDIWALGVLLYKLCYYTTPFEPHGTLAIQNVNYTIPDYPPYSNNVKQLIQSMLRENQNDRPNIIQLHQRVCELQGIKPSSEIMQMKLDQQPQSTKVSSKPTLSSRSSYSPITALSAPISATHSETGTNISSNVVPMRRGRPTKYGAAATTTTTSATSGIPSQTNSSTNAPFNSIVKPMNSLSSYQDSLDPLAPTNVTSSQTFTTSALQTNNTSNAPANPSSSASALSPSSGFEDDFMSLKFGNAKNVPSSTSVLPPKSIAAPIAKKPAYLQQNNFISSSSSSKSLLRQPLSSPLESSTMSNAPASRRGGHSGNRTGNGFGDEFAPSTRQDSKRRAQASLSPPLRKHSSNIPTTTTMVNARMGVDRSAQTSPRMLEKWIQSRGRSSINEEKQQKKLSDKFDNEKDESSDDDDGGPEDAFRQRLSSYSSSGSNRATSLRPNRIIPPKPREDENKKGDTSQLPIELRFPPLSPDTLGSMQKQELQPQSSPSYYSQQEKQPSGSGDESSSDGQNGIFELEDILRNSMLDTPSDDGNGEIASTNNDGISNNNRQNSYTWTTNDTINNNEISNNINNDNINSNSNNNIMNRGNKRTSVIADMTSRYEQLSATAESSSSTTMKKPGPPNLPRKPSNILSPNFTAATTTSTSQNSPHDVNPDVSSNNNNSTWKKHSPSSSLSSPSIVHDQRRDKAPFKPSVAPKPTSIGNSSQQLQQQETSSSSINNNRNSTGGGFLRKPSVRSKPANLSTQQSMNVETEKKDEEDKEQPFEGVGKLKERWQATIAAAKQ